LKKVAGAIPDSVWAEAEALAAELARTGGLGQFIVNLFHTWNGLKPVDRATACRSGAKPPTTSTWSVPHDHRR
jgi:hypothetical protein